MSLPSSSHFVRALLKIRQIDRTAVILGLLCFSAGFLRNQSPLDHLGEGGFALYLVSQLIGFVAILIGFNAATIPHIRGKLGLTSVCAAFHGLQFLLLALAGVSEAWGGVLSMTLTTFRTATFALQTDPETGNPTSTQKTRNLIASAFVVAGFAYMFTGFGLTRPLVIWSDLFKGNIQAIGMTLPLFASLCGAIGDAAPRTRYIRPIKSLGGLINCFYNGLFSGSISHLLNEAGGIVMYAHQFAKQDLPPKRFLGKKLSTFQRLRAYLSLMKNPTLPENYFASLQAAYKGKA